MNNRKFFKILISVQG